MNVAEMSLTNALGFSALEKVADPAQDTAQECI